MLTMHLSGVFPLESLNPAGDDPLDWANVVARGREVSQVVGYILLVGFGLFHGLYGLRNILFELNPAPGLKKLISALLLVLEREPRGAVHQRGARGARNRDPSLRLHRAW